MRMRNFDKATGYIGKMKEEGITPNSRATIIVAKAYVQLGRKIMIGIMRGCNVIRYAGGSNKDVLGFLSGEEICKSADK
ncbi:hypothetical protein TrRE_jg11804 [Triparma retinervis]|uniref:Pentatricopeptide repeat-containing protein n=1 Tax=Triparma retinervis TaxID=2557542 RepID=A0A9W6ZSS5_9STRA|nr:hypothetical protein TrRE_jg11804 [Triparma retinervis]